MEEYKKFYRAIALNANSAMSVIRTYSALPPDLQKLAVEAIKNSGAYLIETLTKKLLSDTAETQTFLIECIKNNHAAIANLITYFEATNDFSILEKNQLNDILNNIDTSGLAYDALRSVPISLFYPKVYKKLLALALNKDLYALFVKTEMLPIPNRALLKKLNNVLLKSAYCSYEIMRKVILKESERLAFGLSAVQDSDFDLHRCKPENLHPVLVEIFDLIQLGFDRNVAISHVMKKRGFKWTNPVQH